MRQCARCVLTAILAVGMVGCGSSNKKATLDIGMLNPATGALGAYGPAMENGARMAINQINDQGGVLGQQLNLVVRDTQSDPTATTTAAKALVGQGIQVIIGAAGSANTLAAAAVTSPKKVVLISGASTSPDLTTFADNGYLFRTVVTDDPQALVLAQKVSDDGNTNVNILYVDNSYGQNLAQKFQTAFEADGGTVVLSKSYPDGTDSSYDYQGDLTAVYNTTPAPDAIVLIAYAGPGTSFLKTWANNKVYNGKWYLTDGMKSTDVASNVGTSDVAGIIGTAAAPATGPTLDAFHAAYKKQYGEASGVYAENYYDAAMLVGLALAKAGKNDGTAVRDALTPVSAPPGTQYDYSDIAAAFKAVKAGKDIDYNGLSGPVDFDSNGDVSGPIEIWQFAADGSITTLQTVTP